MKVSNTIDVGIDPLRVATTVTLWVLVIDARSCVQRLMDITDVVDDETEGKGDLIVGVIKLLLDLINRCVTSHVFAFDEIGLGRESVLNVNFSHLKVRVVIDNFIIRQVRLIDEVPVALP